MNRSGFMKRGLAATAISALAVTGIPALSGSASAEPANAQFGTVTLLSQSTGQASVKNDGTDTTVRLQAAAPATVGSVTFSFTQGGGASQTIATVASRNDDGTFSFEWAVPAGVVGATINLTVTGTPTGGAAQSDAQAVVVNAAGAVTESVNLTSATAAGVFDVPQNAEQNVIVPGTTSATTGTVDINELGPNGATTTADVEAATGATTGTFRGVLDINGYDFTGAPDELVLEAVNGSDDVESYSLYNQVITTVTAVADRNRVPTGAPAQTDNVTVTVVDQNGAPIAGAEVRNSGAGQIEVTDENGQAEFDQQAGTQFYYANATDSAPFEAAAGDRRSADVVIEQVVQVPTRVTAESNDGAAFDFDENATGDLTVEVLDQNGDNVVVGAGQTVEYYYQITPFDTTVAPSRFPLAAAGNLTATGPNADGEYSVELPPAQQVSGTYQLFAGVTDNAATPADEGIDPVQVLSFKVGQAEIDLDGGDDQNGVAGGQVTVSGDLLLEDGTPLAGRNVQLSYTQAAGGNAGFADGTDAGTELDAQVTVVTTAAGAFSANVIDPVTTPQTTEVGGSVSAETVAGTNDGDNPLAGPETQNIDFVSATPPAGAVASVLIDEEGTPGLLETGTVRLDTNGTTAGGGVANTQVTLNITEGFFTDGDLVATTNPNAQYGNFVSDGKTITVVTDANGDATFSFAIGRNTGFDDDGLVSDTVRATSGTATAGTDAIEWDSSDPINGSEVRLELSPENEQDGPTDPADVNQEVSVDVYTEDQFGNLVGGEAVFVNEDGDDAFIDTPNFGNTAISDFDADGDFTVVSTDDDVVTVTGEWDVNRTEGTAVTGPIGAGTDTFSDSLEITFADFVLADATVTLTGSPENTAPVNSAVTETLRVVDVNGTPRAGLQVTFTRTGPGAVAETVERTTNANGVAQYAFVGTAQGTANISAEVTDGSEVRTVTDTVTFGAGPVEPTDPVRIVASARANNNGAANDRITAVTAPRRVAAGAPVRLFTRINGEVQRLQARRLNAQGQFTFNVRDRNGNAQTVYWVTVGPREGHTGDRSTNIRVR